MSEKQITPLQECYADDCYVVYSADNVPAETYIRALIDDVTGRPKHDNYPEYEGNEVGNELHGLDSNAMKLDADAAPKHGDVIEADDEPIVYVHPSGTVIEVYPDDSGEVVYGVTFDDDSDMDSPLLDRLRVRFNKEYHDDFEDRVARMVHDLGIKALVD